MRNDELMVTVPAKLLNDLAALAGGYTMSKGRYLDARAASSEAYDILWREGYEYGLDTELLFKEPQ